MNKIFLLTVVICLAVFSITLVSAITVPSAKTVVAGKIYNADYTDTIADATVNVTCNNVTLSELSESDGTYSISFNTTECDIGDDVNVKASKGALYGEKNGIVLDGDLFDIPVEIAVVNVPLIPEFGTVIGILTMISAIGVFFFVRRK